jgi:hypothetical protein
VGTLERWGFPLRTGHGKKVDGLSERMIKAQFIGAAPANKGSVVLNTSIISKIYFCTHRILICIALLIGAWLIIESLTAVSYIANGHRAASLMHIYSGILFLGGLLFVSGLFLKFGKERYALMIFVAATIFSAIRWIKYLDLTSPFGEFKIWHSDTQSLLIFLWQTQHFATTIMTLIFSLLTYGFVNK